MINSKEAVELAKEHYSKQYYELLQSYLNLIIENARLEEENNLLKERVKEVEDDEM